MKISLILCTKNRLKEVNIFLKSLSKQIYQNFELIIVEQNEDKRVKKLVKNYNFDIIYLTSKIGLSLGRNKGLQYVDGDIVGFPDDDCFYPEELLYNVANFFNKNKYDILTGKTIDKKTKKIVAGKNIIKPQEIKPLKISGSSTTLFIKHNKDINFDEKLGIGSTFYAEEENDLIFRLLKKGYIGYYNPDIIYVYHPPSDLDYSNIKRAMERGIGLGAFIKKNINSLEGKIYFIKYNIIRPLFGSLFHLAKLNFIKSKFYFYKFLGIWKGFIKYNRIKDDTI
jgi:glycosyltransferase involved in cell wall biosynthesis